MMLTKKPYFFTNKEWYGVDSEKGVAILTDKAPKEAVDSYNKYYEREISCGYIPKRQYNDNI